MRNVKGQSKWVVPSDTEDKDRGRDAKKNVWPSTRKLNFIIQRRYMVVSKDNSL